MTTERQVQIDNMAASLLHRCSIDPAGRELTCRLTDEPVKSNAGAMADWAQRQLEPVPTQEIPKHFRSLFDNLVDELEEELA